MDCLPVNEEVTKKDKDNDAYASLSNLINTPEWGGLKPARKFDEIGLNIMRRAKSLNEYIELVDQAIFEVGELRAADEWEQEEGGGILDFPVPLINQLRQLKEELTAECHIFGERDLSLMKIVRANARQIPFNGLFDIINQTHRLGLEN
ncbi:hypothetical protein CCP3SC5AM1_200026 [Gammaproteobacteria bacterium]